MPRAAGLRARGRPPVRSGVLVLDRVRIHITQDEYFPDLRCFYIQLNILNSGLGTNSYVDCSVRRPGSSILLLSPVRCRCLSTDYLHGLGCRDCLSFTSDSTQESREDAAVLLTSARKQTMDLGLLQLLNWKDGVCK